MLWGRLASLPPPGFFYFLRPCSHPGTCPVHSGDPLICRDCCLPGTKLTSKKERSDSAPSPPPMSRAHINTRPDRVVKLLPRSHLVTQRSRGQYGGCWTRSHDAVKLPSVGWLCTNSRFNSDFKADHQLPQEGGSSGAWRPCDFLKPEKTSLLPLKPHLSARDTPTRQRVLPSASTLGRKQTAPARGSSSCTSW